MCLRYGRGGIVEVVQHVQGRDRTEGLLPERQSRPVAANDGLGCLGQHCARRVEPDAIGAREKAKKPTVARANVEDGSEPFFFKSPGDLRVDIVRATAIPSQDVAREAKAVRGEVVVRRDGPGFPRHSREELEEPGRDAPCSRAARRLACRCQMLAGRPCRRNPSCSWSKCRCTNASPTSSRLNDRVHQTFRLGRSHPVCTREYHEAVERDRTNLGLPTDPLGVGWARTSWLSSPRPKWVARARRNRNPRRQRPLLPGTRRSQGKRRCDRSPRRLWDRSSLVPNRTDRSRTRRRQRGSDEGVSRHPQERHRSMPMADTGVAARRHFLLACCLQQSG